MSDWGLDESGLNLTDQDIVDCSGNMELLIVMEVSKFQASPFDALKSSLCIFLRRGLNADIKEIPLALCKVYWGSYDFWAFCDSGYLWIQGLYMNLPEISSWKFLVYLRKWDI